MSEHQVKYIVKYANGLYLCDGNGSRRVKSRMVKYPEFANRFGTEEEARAKANARAVVHGHNEDLKHYTIEPYKLRGKHVKPKAKEKG